MPSNVRRFELLWYSSMLLAVGTVPFDNSIWGDSSTAFRIFAVCVMAIFCFVSVLLIWLTAHRRKNGQDWHCKSARVFHGHCGL